MAGYYAANQIHPIVETPSCLSDPRSYNKRCANVIFKIKVGNIYKLIRVLRVLRSSKGRLNLHSFNHIYNVESWILIKYDVCDVLNSFVCDNPWFFFQDALRILHGNYASIAAGDTELRRIWAVRYKAQRAHDSGR